jgi:hypothetical protein
MKISLKVSFRVGFLGEPDSNRTSGVDSSDSGAEERTIAQLQVTFLPATRRGSQVASDGWRVNWRNGLGRGLMAAGKRPWF